jgi:hypothetical protein
VYRTIGCWTSWGYRDCSGGDKCLNWCIIHSFHNLSFSKDFEDEIQSTHGVILRGGWVNGLDEQCIWIGTNHGTLLVWILIFCCFWNDNDVAWDCPKWRVLGRRRGGLDTQFWEE